MGGGQQR
jgi:hypothetical protein